MEKEPIKKHNLKKTLTIGGLALMLGVSTVGFAKADSGSHNNFQRGEDRPNYQQEEPNQRHEKPFQHNQENRDRNKDHWDSDKRDEKCDRDKRHNENRNKKERKVTIVGKVTSIDSDEMTVKIGKKNYKVDIESATFKNRRGRTIDKDDIKTGKRVMVKGTKDGRTIEAKYVKCLSC